MADGTPLRDFYNDIEKYDDEIPEREERLEKLYDTWSDDYEKYCVILGYKGPIVAGNVMEELFGKNTKVSILECGSGTGLIGEQLHSRGFVNIVGVDLSDKSLEVARKKKVYTKLLKCTVGKDKLPFGNDAFDALLCCASTGATHIQPDSFTDLVRVVKQGGYIVIIERKTQPGGNSAIVDRFEEKISAVLDSLQTSKKISLVEERIIPDYLDKTDGLVQIMKVL